MEEGWPVFLLSWPQPPLIDVSLSRAFWDKHHLELHVCGGPLAPEPADVPNGEPGTSVVPLSALHPAHILED